MLYPARNSIFNTFITTLIPKGTIFEQSAEKCFVVDCGLVLECFFGVSRITKTKLSHKIGSKEAESSAKNSVDSKVCSESTRGRVPSFSAVASKTAYYD